MNDSGQNWRMLPRVEYALVVGGGEECASCGFHYIPDGDTLTIDFNGAAKLCDALVGIVRKELKKREWVRIVRQRDTPCPDSYL